MKKIVALMAVVALLLCSVACAKKEAKGGYSVAMVTDVGNIDDQSFNQYTWEGCKDWAAANGATANYYRPSEDSDDARIEAIKTAIEKGANVVVCPGYLFAGALNAVPAQYPDITFIGIDMTSNESNPGGADVPEPTANTVVICYKEEQAGYLAGYAVVKDGYTKLGFLGGIDVPAVVRYGHGFIQGANDAAKELGNAADISVNYWYSGSFAPTDEIKAKMSGWYTDGTEIIFSCGGGIVYSALGAAEETANGKVVGVDNDQGGINERVVTSAIKDLKGSTMNILSAVKDNGGKLPEKYAGHGLVYGISDNAVGIPTAAGSWRFAKFTVDEYNAAFKNIQSGAVTISNATDAHPAVEIAVDYQND